MNPMNHSTNDDRLAELLSAAADLRPSPDLERRVTTALLAHRPARRAWPRRVGLGLALSGAAGAAVVLAFALLPRESSAEELLRRAAQNQDRVSGRFRAEAFVNGAWRRVAAGILAPGWQRIDQEGGGLTLQTPEGRYERSDREGPVRRVPPEVEHGDEGLALGDHMRFLRRLGKEPKMTKDEPHLEGGRRVQRVTILVRPDHDREILTLDADADLPIDFLQEQWVGGRWTPFTRATFAFPGPEPGAQEFWAGIDRAQILDTAALARLWERRLTAVLGRLPLEGGESLALRDVRALPAGDVLVLYTGPENLRARLVGADGTRYVRVPFPLNDGRMIPRSRPPLAPEGAPLRGLWFTPETEGAWGAESVRLEVLGAGERSFALRPIQERAALPEWAEVIDYQRLAADPEGCREDARLMAAYDGWLDSQGHRVPGTYRLAPVDSRWGEFDPPRPGLRRDPAAAAAAAIVFRGMMARAKANEREINPLLVENWLGRFEREAGSPPRP